MAHGPPMNTLDFGGNLDQTTLGQSWDKLAIFLINWN